VVARPDAAGHASGATSRAEPQDVVEADRLQDRKAVAAVNTSTAPSTHAPVIRRGRCVVPKDHWRHQIPLTPHALG
jgi:hypothetical protein